MLNQAQKQAVEHVGSPLLIVAGAGTGKTTVITEKIRYLIDQKLATPENILALTFTDKAAGEMVERIEATLSIGYVDLQISTFHSFCQRLLEQYGLDVGIPNQFRLLTPTDAWLLVREHLDEFDLDYYRPLGNPARHIHELIAHFGKCKDELIAPADYLAYAENARLNTDSDSSVMPQNDSADDDGLETEDPVRLTEIANAYHTYNQLLLQNNALDFGDLIFYTIKLLQERPHIRAALQKRYTHILVDEFQDVNWSQYQLVRLLAGDGHGLTVVGDDDQSIYAFRGASVANILRFYTDYPTAEKVILTENYRSRQEILDVAYRSVVGNNPDRLEVKLGVDKRLVSKAVTSEGDMIAAPFSFLSAETVDDEVQQVVNKIFTLKKQNVALRDIAILVRANSHADPFLRALEAAHIPFAFRASSGLYRQSVVLDCVNFLKVIDGYHESVAMYRLLHLPCLPFLEIDVQKIVIDGAKRKSISFYEALTRAREFGVSAAGAATAQKLLHIIHEGAEQAKQEKPSIVLYNFLEKIGYLAYLTAAEQNGEIKVVNQIFYLQQFLENIAAFETANPEARAHDYLEHLTYILASGDDGAMPKDENENDGVRILTVHASKGLEFPYVFVVNMVEERFPTRRRGEALQIPTGLIKEQLPEGDGHIEEERRLFYVAITRAKLGLFFTFAQNYGGVRAKKPSRFLAEIGLAPTEKEKTKQKIALRNEKIMSLEQTDSFLYPLPDKFSFSQIKSYETCPYQYKLAHILKIPTRGHASFSFGTSMHATMQHFYERLQELNSAEQVSLFSAPTPARTEGVLRVPTLAELLALYEKNWNDNWFESKRQREEYYKKGKEILGIFYAAQEGRWTIPATLESSFKIRVGDYILHGRIDRIDQLPDGTLEIIDYKTGASKTKVVGDEKDQLLLYQIAAEKLPEYNHIGKPSKLSYLYLNDNITVSFLGDAEDTEKLQHKLISTIDSIMSRNFEATPSAHVCGHCDFRDLCEFRI